MAEFILQIGRLIYMNILMGDKIFILIRKANINKY